VSFAAITLCVASQRVFIVVSLHFVIDSVRKLLDTLSYEKWLVVLLSINRNNQVTKLSKRKNILHNVSSVPLQSACEVVLVLPCQ
jgi:uncharacterized membrane protein